jgi:very-short-patch-repair endonuclease
MPPHYRTTAPTLARARRLRREMTEAEKRLWRGLREGELAEYHFRKQVPAGAYILDFCCLRKKLVVEVDGGQHAEISAAEARRNRWLRAEGYTVLRFWNSAVLENLDGVLWKIGEVLKALPARF